MLRPRSRRAFPERIRRAVPRVRAGRLFALASASLLLLPLAARAQPGLDPTRFAGEGWELIGDFQGSYGSSFVEELRNTLFELENTGEFFDDLGTLTVGLGWKRDGNRIQWDNHLDRSVVADQAPLEPGQILSPDDRSGYLSLDQLISRGRMDIVTVPEVVQKSGLKARVEGGATLLAVRHREAIRIADRPLDEVFAERAEERRLFEEYRGGGDSSLLKNGTLALAAGADRFGEWFGERSADTEHAAIFFERLADPFLLGLDLGIPVRYELLSGEEPGLEVGDLVQHTTFFGVSPVGIGINAYGLEAGYQVFFRFTRQTTLVRESESVVRVRVRNYFGRGQETVPLKLRPRLRLFGLFQVAYSIYERKFDLALGALSEVVYRVDLESPRGRDALRSLLGAAGRFSFRPLAEAALEQDGAEILSSMLRKGPERFSTQRLELFSWVSFRDLRLAKSELVTTPARDYWETTRMRSRSYRRGKSKRWQAASSITSQSELAPGYQTRGDWTGREQSAIEVVSSVQDDKAEAAYVRQTADRIARTLDLAETPRILADLGRFERQETSRFFANLRLSLAEPQAARVVTATDEQIWLELADVFLGPEHREAWRTREARRAWRRQDPVTRDAQILPAFGDGDGGREVLRRAKRILSRFGHLRDYEETGDASSLARFYSKLDETLLIQAVVVRLAGGTEPGQVGFHFEIFTDQMMRAVTVSNDTVYEFDPGIEDPDVQRRMAISIRERDLIEPSPNRMAKGFLWLRRDAAPGEDCWKLRIFSDLLFDESLELRVDLREAETLKKDRFLSTRIVSIGGPDAVIETPFKTARYYYDVELPPLPALVAKEPYSLLLRVLEPGGFPVSEEQQIRFRWPEEPLPAHCVAAAAAGQAQVQGALPAAAGTPSPD